MEPAMSRKAFVLAQCVLGVVSLACGACGASGDDDAKGTQHKGAGTMSAANAMTGTGGLGALSTRCRNWRRSGSKPGSRVPVAQR